MSADSAQANNGNSSAPLVKHSTFFFDNTLVVVRVENVLFNVHKYQLTKSKVFADKFAEAEQSWGRPADGSSTDFPLQMEGASAADFESLLTVLYSNNPLALPSHFSTHQPDPKPSLIIPAFRLANKWEFVDLRAYLMPLAEKALSDVDKVAFASEFGIKDWLAPAVVKLCQRPEPLTVEEAAKLNFQSLLLIFRIREQFRPPPKSNGDKFFCPGCTSVSWVGGNYTCGYWLGLSSGEPMAFALFLPPSDLHTSASAKPILNSTAADSKQTDSQANIPAPIVKHSKFFFDNALVVIQIENVQFNVHKYQLVKSQTFADMFAIAEQAKKKGDDVEGSSTDNPIKMEGVSASDFECLLTVLYATHFSTQQPEPKTSLIISAFRLANMWNFADLRACLLPLAEKVLGDVDKIVFAREFHVDKWVSPAYTRLCQRKEPLSSEEAAKIGLNGVLLVSRIREETYCSPSGASCCSRPNPQVSCSYCGNYWCTDSTADKDIEKKIDAWMKSGCVFTKNA